MRMQTSNMSVATQVAMLGAAGLVVGLFAGCSEHFEFEGPQDDYQARSSSQSYKRAPANSSESDDGSGGDQASGSEGSSGSSGGSGSSGSDEGSSSTGSSDSEGRTWIGTNQKLEAMKEDILEIDPPSKREDIRYITLVNLHNSSISDEELEVARQAFFLTLNSLSQGNSVTKPEAVDQAKTIFRIDLEDYGWDANTWAEVAQAYPYAVKYDQDSEIFSRDERFAERVRDETGTEIPSVQADWFIDEATQELYYDLLELPETAGQLEQQLGIDIEQNIQDENVDRAGFDESGLTEQNRVVERHELDGSSGALWVGYTFETSAGEQNVFENPVGFQEDGREMLFNLENGLQAYFLTDGDGERVKKAEQALVTDASRPDNAVEAGISCMGCHNGQGIIPVQDEVREFAQTNIAGSEREEVLALYPSQRRLDSLQTDDAERFLGARETAGVDSDVNTPVLRTVLRYEANMTVGDVAAVLGITESRLKEELESGALASLPDSILTLRTDGTVARDTFEKIENEVVCALSVGNPINAAGEVLSCDEVLQ